MSNLRESSQAHSDSASGRHVCHCGKSFARKEHLTRHRATHDQRVAHVCRVCQRQFSRKELLRRHSTVHDPNHVRIAVSCDACRANKTKCSGGVQCALCARRRIPCTIKDTPRRPEPMAAIDEGCSNVSGNDGSAAPELPAGLNTRREPAEVPQLRGRDLLGHDMFQHLAIAPVQSITSRIPQTTDSAMQVIEELLLQEADSMEGSVQPSGDVYDSLCRVLKVYFGNFHVRWPILSAPSFDARTAKLLLAASVCVVGVSLGDQMDPEERLCALRVHDLLLQHFIQDLINQAPLSQDEPWPLELFQAILITLVFSLYRTDQRSVTRAMHLHATFITHLRQTQAFKAEVLAHHLRTHFTGSFTPYTLSIREQFKRLLAQTYQVDAYMSLAHKHPPLPHRQEIGVHLATTYAGWNSHGLDVLARRLQEEPSKREMVSIFEFESPNSSLSSPLLIEDVTLGLCGTLQAIWVLTPPSSSAATKTRQSNTQEMLLIERLDLWQQELDKVQKLIDSRISSGNSADYLVLAYRGEDDLPAAAIERIKTLLGDDFASSTKTRRRSAETWQLTKFGREALGCALRVLDLAGSSKASPHGASGNPLTRHTLGLACELARKILASCEKCECRAEQTQGQGCKTEHDIDQWVDIGGRLCVDNLEACVCELDAWMGRFDIARRECTISVEDEAGTASA